MKKVLLFFAAGLVAGWSGLPTPPSARAGTEFEPPIPKFPYAPTDPKGNPYCVAATDLVFSPRPPYVQASSEVAKLEKSKRPRRPAKREPESVDAKGRP
ncbi:conserved exported protein of unknown function [Methylacidimicrobium sp. AP8]|uniref:hypothetical protein n=1 Tax=Methylacidimicrobium sp. AP8 TaxID=2730359 RepID=UPI0018BFE13E|nr:hypothetical protein [Methylacidimicrobium sp. AP8]CAB4243635.1 conserved exported protein of unknown function [Methylacidimicrobium sp. AP8]